MRSGPRLAIVTTLLIIAVLAVLSTGDVPDAPGDRVMCDGCHDGFAPFSYNVDSPTEVPQGEVFTIRVTMTNEGDHTVLDPELMVDLEPEGGMILEGGAPWTDEDMVSGSVGFRGTADHPLEVGYSAVEARFTLGISSGLLDYTSLSVIGAEGGHWATGGSANTLSIILDDEDLLEGGQGLYTVVVNHERGPRNLPYDLSMEVDYGPSLGIIEGPDLRSGESHTFAVGLVGTVKGPGRVPIVVTGIAYYEHGEGQHDEERFSFDRTLEIDVGDELVGGGGGDGGGGWSASLLTAGQVLGFLSAALLAGSVATSGHLPRLPRRANIHCLVSKALAGVFIVHWVVLWAGPYGGTLGGIGTGSLMLVLILLLALGGAWPELLEGRVMGWSNRVLHRNMTYALVLVLIVHVLMNGSHFAFVQ
jgi:hypothetical protein